ncbi:MAG: heavy metal translocating P-type ATPase metal-binding domain-containing protein, partial [Deltaproteobacteria bacterium]|nr:heavy metal translocating P-type ATPase metal-binding domain-containing protein [Deltaproteobacteria bacterium]
MKEPAPGRPAARPHAPRCAHCGLPVPPALVRDGALLQFCCLACEHVHEVLQGLGFQEYYHRARLAGALPAAARVSGRGFEDFDETGFQAQHVTTDATGRRSAQLYLEGVHCAACVWLVEKLPEVVPGLASVRLNLATSVAEVVFDGDETRLSAIGRALDDVGYTPHAYRSDETRRLRRREERTLLLRLGVAAAAAMNIMFLQGALYAGELQGGLDRGLETFFRWLALGLSLPVMLFSARPFLVAAWAGLRRRVPHIDLPVSLALLAAFAASAAATLRGAGPVYFDSLAALVALLLGARYLQARGQRFALERAESLRGVAFASFARRLEAGDPAATPVEVPLAALRPDDRVEVRSGELVPVDGTVLAGRSALDNGVLTGESEPVEVQEGDHVHAGATNLGARLVVRVEATGTATRVGGLLALVEDSLSRRPHLVELADRASRWFVVAVLLLAGVAGFLGWMRSPEEALERLVALLVVTCPC